jgi:molecular chaperone GrpE
MGAKQKNDAVDQNNELHAKIEDLTADLQRTRADFENYRKRTEAEKTSARTAGHSSAILKLLPVVDLLERAVAHTPEDLADNAWVQGVTKLPKQLDSALGALNVTRIEAKPNTPFDPTLHEAIQFDEDAEGDAEVIAEELQAGYMLDGTPIRPAMVRVTKK